MRIHRAVQTITFDIISSLLCTPLCFRFVCLQTLSCLLHRLVTEVHPHEDSFFNCVACTQDTSGTPLLFAGTNDGIIRQLALEDINADERDEPLEEGGVVALK